jgi:lipid II:glycine glycyltransferase (peptidoglycan interpeptide bridge formation enzyme)
MNWDQVLNTIQLIDADFFIVTNSDKVPISAAMVFNIAEKIVQIIYWGDIQEFSLLRTMNFLSFKLFEYYKKAGIQIVDIGPSSQNSIPNYGLGEFKESLGCKISTKATFRIELQ